MKTDRYEPGVIAVIQARLSSMRFPRKVLVDLNGLPLVEFMIERVKASGTVHEIVLAVPEEELDSPLADIAVRQGIGIRGGPDADVLSRIAGIVRDQPQEIVVRLTADCPLVDPEVIDSLVSKFQNSDFDYLRTGRTYPDGLDVEVTTKELLLLANTEASAPDQREHVTPWIANSPHLKQSAIEYTLDLGHLRLTVDEPEDADVVRSVVAHLPDANRNIAAIAGLWSRRPDLFAPNLHFVRDEGASLTDSQKLWRRAKRVIPGGVSLLSKRPDMHLPEEWPTYFTEAVGCRVTSLDGAEFIDMGMMGVGTSILGFGDPRVNEAVSDVIRQGTVSTLNCPEEVLLAERLLGLHSWATRARFARSGGEACAMAVRIARAASGKDKVAICGYHGWHDWYLAANISHNNALDGHLLPGLSALGVPRALKGTTHSFAYNDLESLRALISEDDLGVIVMEVERSSRPEPGFLEGVRDLATRNGIVLVFDESTSGFRQVLGGHHLALGVYPDIAVFGKTLGNGFAITALIGRDSVMDVANDLFISSTFWSERVGPAAGLAAIAAMEEEDAPSRIHSLGLRYRELLVQALGGSISFSGLPALTSLNLNVEIDPRRLRTFLTLRLLQRGYLGGVAMYAALPHENELDHFVSEVTDILSEALEVGDQGVDSVLAGRNLATSGFARLA